MMNKLTGQIPGRRRLREINADVVALERLIDCIAQESHAVGISGTMTPEGRVRAMAAEIRTLRSALEAATKQNRALEDALRQGY